MLKAKLDLMGIEVSEDHFYTSALSTARFLAQQHPEKGGRVFAMGEEGLIKALENEGFLMVEE